MDLGPDPDEGEKPGCRFAMQSNASVRVRSGMDKAFVESVGGRELTPVGHGVTAVRLALAPAMFLLVANGEVARRRPGPRFANVALHCHEETVALPVGVDPLKVLRGQRKPDPGLEGIVRC